LAARRADGTCIRSALRVVREHTDAGNGSEDNDLRQAELPLRRGWQSHCRTALSGGFDPSSVPSSPSATADRCRPLHASDVLSPDKPTSWTGLGIDNDLLA